MLHTPPWLNAHYHLVSCPLGFFLRTCRLTPMKTAILVDAAYFLHRYVALCGETDDGSKVAQYLCEMCLHHNNSQ